MDEEIIAGMTAISRRPLSLWLPRGRWAEWRRTTGGPLGSVSGGADGQIEVSGPILASDGLVGAVVRWGVLVGICPLRDIMIEPSERVLDQEAAGLRGLLFDDPPISSA